MPLTQASMGKRKVHHNFKLKWSSQPRVFQWKDATGWGLNVICYGRQQIWSKNWSCEMKYLIYIEIRRINPHSLRTELDVCTNWIQNEDVARVIFSPARSNVVAFALVSVVQPESLTCSLTKRQRCIPKLLLLMLDLKVNKRKKLWSLFERFVFRDKIRRIRWTNSRGQRRQESLICNIF